MDEKILNTAAEMCHGSGDYDWGLLNSSLIQEIREISNLYRRVGGKKDFLSRQIIALTIVNWRARNPSLKAYGE
jgi:hypothetical protein